MKLMKEITLTAISEAVCQCNDSRFEEKLQRLSNNNCPKFSDKEIISIHLRGKAQQLPTRRAFYRFVKQTMLDKFPALRRPQQMQLFDTHNFPSYDSNQAGLFSSRYIPILTSDTLQNDR